MTDLHQLVALIERASGVVVPERDLGRLERLAQEIADRRTGGDLGQLVARLRRHRGGRDWRTLLAAITVKESYLFRSPRQFEALSTLVVPELVRRRPDRRLTVWSAGCARGEEAATVAMLLAESPLLTGWAWRILATDVDENAIEEASLGRFGGRAVARVPAALRQRYLQPRGDGFELAGFLRRRIDFEPLNLVASPAAIPGAPFDIILLRNVLIYFRPETQRRVVETVAAALAEDGYLFLGPSESLLQHDVPVQAVDLDGCFVYRHRAQVPAETAAPPPPQQVPASSSRAPTRGRRPTRGGSDSGPEPVVADRAAEVRELLIGEALGRAAALGRQLSEREPDNVELRAVSALAIDAVGDEEGAVRAYRAALYLDPALFQIRHRLASVLRRRGETERASAELRAILSLIATGRARTLTGWRELGLDDAERVAAACRAELRE